MPELPEVETVRRGLESHILKQPIRHLDIRLPKLIKSDPQVLQDTLAGNRIMQLDRRGKLLIANLQKPAPSNQNHLLIHLKMTGQLIYQSPQQKPAFAGGHPWPPYNSELPNKYSHLILHFQNGGALYFNDQRQFGYWKLVNKKEKQQTLQKFGIEPLTPEFTQESFAKLFQNSRRILKALLLDQQRISGIGNIYADEICFYAGVLPGRRVNTLTQEEISQLYQGTQQIIQKAIQHRGTTIEDYTDADAQRGNFSDYLQVFKREGLSCLRCKNGIINKTKIAGRGTHFCPTCQV